jgi:hypothetical protein
VFLLAVLKVRLGLAAHFRAFGSSMEPVIPSGSRVTLAPVDVDRIEVGDIVVARVRAEITGTSGPANGWIPFESVYGVCTRIGDESVPGSEEKVRRHRFSQRIGRRRYAS